MPRLIDYGVRFELIREAILRVCVRDGAAALSMATVAAEMKISVPTLRRTMAYSDALPAMGAAFIERRRHVRRMLNRGKVGWSPLQLVQGALERELPLDDERLHDEVAWAEIVHTFRDDRVAQHLADEHDYRDRLMSDAVEQLSVPAALRPLAIAHLRALHDGLHAALRARRTSVEEARLVLAAHLADLADLASRAPDPVA